MRMSGEVIVTSTTRLLVVNNDARARRELYESLKKLGYGAIDFATCEQIALCHITANARYKLVIAEWDQTPNLLDKVRQRSENRYLPFLLAIDGWQKKFVEIVRDDGAVLYFTKPFEPAVLKQRIEQVFLDSTRMKAAAVRKSAKEPVKENEASQLWQILRRDI